MSLQCLTLSIQRRYELNKDHLDKVFPTKKIPSALFEIASLLFFSSHCSSNPIFIPNLIPKHKPNRFFISKRHLIPLFNQFQTGIPYILESSQTLDKFESFDLSHGFDHLRADDGCDHGQFCQRFMGGLFEDVENERSKERA